MGENNNKSIQDAQTRQSPSGIKRAWGILMSLFMLVISGLAVYYSYLILGFFGKEKFFPLIFAGLSLITLIIIFVTLGMTWNKWFALIIVALILLLPIAYFIWIYNYCANCSQQAEAISKFTNLTTYFK